MAGQRAPRASDDEREGGGADVRERKEELRRGLKAARAQLSAAERAERSEQIAARLLESLPWSRVRRLHIYRSVAAWGEVDTRPVVARLGALHPGIEIESPGASHAEQLPEGVFDVIVVPVLGFDERNYRLGLGAAFYDRFLATQPQAHKIGLAYGFARLPRELPRERHDVPLDLIITDVGIAEIGSNE